MDTAGRIDLLFRTLHVFVTNPTERRLVAGNLAGLGLTAADIRLVYDELRSSSRDDSMAQALLVTTTRTPALVREIADDIKERQELVRSGVAGEASGMRFVSGSNPYGWAKPANVLGQDHSRPGEWNGFRQGYNLTLEEARAAGTMDCRRHGCSRVEVLGEFDKKRVKAGKDVGATAEWNADVVAVVQEIPQQQARERDVYGAGPTP